MSLCHSVILSLCHSVILSLCHSVILSLCHSVKTISDRGRRPRIPRVGPRPPFYRIQNIRISPNTHLSVILPVIYSIIQNTDRLFVNTHKFCQTVKKTEQSQTIQSLGLSASVRNPSTHFTELHQILQNISNPSPIHHLTSYLQHNPNYRQIISKTNILSNCKKQFWTEDPAGWTPPNIFKRKRRTTEDDPRQNR
jgi:hypothetical protein